MGKQRRSAADARRGKREREAAERLTFLEKVVMRALPGRQVPAESGVRFAISSKAKDDGLCLVFQVDDPDVPIVEEGPRPDYLVVHASRFGCLITIVEMKGTEQKNIEHGIDQIRAMYRRLRKEMATCLPGPWRRPPIQGVLLMPQGAHLNRKKIEDARGEGVEIFPLQYHHQAELYPYISRPVSRTERYAHESLPRARPELNPIERLLAEGKLEKRVRDGFFTERRGDADDTFFLSFRRPGDPEGAYMGLSATLKDVTVAFTPAASKCRVEVDTHLTKHGLQCSTLRVRELSLRGV